MNPFKPRVLAPNPKKISLITDVLNEYKLKTICEEASCPNRGECYENRSTTFLVLGDTCTRSCHFCGVKKGKPTPPDPTEPYRIALAVKDLNLDYTVITSVDRDDLTDFGATHLAQCVKEIKKVSPKTKVELLTPDFNANSNSLDIIVASKADKLAHNQESVRRISKKLRPQSDYDRSLQTLSYYADHSSVPIKSSLMLGLGESENELFETLCDLKNAGVTHLTIGQYLQPNPKLHPVRKYYDTDYFKKICKTAYDLGFKSVVSGALVRSSYFAHL